MVSLAGSRRTVWSQLEGVSFCTRRNAEGALNLWEALDLPDQDVNVILKKANAIPVERRRRIRIRAA